MKAAAGPRNRRSLRGVAELMNRWNARHPWSHNDHFHDWILRNLPEPRSTALDVGCGRGGLVARLAERIDSVTGIDPDEEMVSACRGRFAAQRSVDIRQLSLLDTSGSYDVVTMVSSLHHLPLELALGHAASLVAPGGRLLVVGMSRLEGFGDVALDSVSLGLNPLVGMVKHPRALRVDAAAQTMPVRDPEQTFHEIRSVAERVLPGARLRRRLFFRYTLRWDRAGH